MNATAALELARAALLSFSNEQRQAAVAAIDLVLSPPSLRDGTAAVFELPYPPSQNHYWRFGIVGKGRGAHAMAYLTKEAKDYKSQVAMFAKVMGWQPTAAEVELNVSVYRPRRIGDLDNTLKVSLDSLKGAAYLDDNQVTKITAERFDDKDNPRCVVIVTPR